MRRLRLVGALLLASALRASAAVVNLLPEGPIALHPDDFADDAKACTEAEVLRARYDEFALPANATRLAFYFRGAVDCDSSALGVMRRVTLFGFGPVDVVADCGRGALVLDGGVLGRLLFALPSWGSLGGAGFMLAVDPTREPVVQMCVGGANVQGDSALGGALLAELRQNRALLGEGVSLGARGDAQRSARADVAQFWVEADGAGACAPEWPPLAAAAAANHAPVVRALAQQPPGEVAVGDSVSFSAAADDEDEDPLRLKLTFYGVPPDECAAAECGDLAFQAQGAGGQVVSLAAVAVRFPRPGRWLVRAQASDGRGAVATRDHSVLVRKVGDTQRRAPCCRHTPHIVAGALGRPLDHTVFRAPSVYAAAERLGWSREYVDGADVEAERLFDYTVLAPPPPPSPLQLLRCADTRLAGAGSPPVFGLTGGGASNVAGHNKALVLIPMGFAWANATEVECQAHWSGWQESSPHKRAASAGGAACSVACTRAGTEQLVRETGMVEQLNQALIQGSFGALSLSPRVAVLDEVLLGRLVVAEGADAYSYYEAPARAALAARGLPSWMYIALVPLNYARRPPHRAWSGGATQGGAVITQCYATHYYAQHETGHRMGFHHVDLYTLDDARAAPADPLGPGAIAAGGYVDRLDAMSCCQSDYGLYHRTLAGWLRGSGRLVLPRAELRVAKERRLVLWPFDRSESRGRLVSVAVRRGDGEVLLLGFRSASHWQDAGSGGLPPEETRQNVRGIQVEYLRRQGAAKQWSERGLLDFNVVHGDWPDALPAGTKQPPRQSQFALLKEGYSWFDPGSGLLVALERVAECDGLAGLRPHNYTAFGFFGFRGEWPFKEQYLQADYSGYKSLECAHITVRTAAAAPAGRLELSLAAEAAALPGAAAAAAAAAQSCSLQRAASLSVSWGGGVRARSVVWRDGANRTLGSVAVAPGQTAASLAASVLPVSAHVLAEDGRHTHAAFSAEGEELVGRLKYYEPGALSYRRQHLGAVQAQPPECAADSAGLVWLIAGVAVLSVALAAGVVVLGVLGAQWRAARRPRRRAKTAPADAPGAQLPDGGGGL